MIISNEFFFTQLRPSPFETQTYINPPIDYATSGHILSNKGNAVWKRFINEGKRR